MRLTRLALRNFRSHPDTDLDLLAVQAAVIAGPTGGGKSSLLDALLWAPFGRTLGRDVVRLGQDQCQVVEEFTTGESEYRVTRTLSRKTARGKTELQLATRQDGGRWVPISGKSIDETEAKIREVLGLSYEAMISGPVSPQDQYRRFLQPPAISIDGKQYTGPQARLQILAQMMGLEYEPLRRKVLDLLKDLRPEETRQKDIIGNAAVQLDQLPIRTLALDNVVTAMLRTRDQLSTAEHKEEEDRRGVAELQQEVARLTERLAGLDGLKHEEKRLADRSKALAERQARHQAILSHKAEVQAKAEEDRGLAERLDRLRSDQTTVEGLVDTRRATEATSAKAKHEREKGISREKAEIERVISAGKARAETECLMLAVKVDEHHRRGGLIGRVPCQDTPEFVETCPLLAEARDALLNLSIVQTAHESAKAWAPDAASLARLVELEALIVAGATDADLANATSARVASEQNLATLREDVRQVEVARKLLARWVAVVPQIELAEQELPGIADELVQVVIQQHSVADRILAMEDDATALGQATEAHRQADLALHVVSAEIGRLRVDERGLVEQGARARVAVTHLEELDAERKEAEAKLLDVRRRITTFETLAEAYKAIPLMVIEAIVIPEVEPEANRLLARISPNGMRLSLPTQRALKSKEGVADGLEIVVQDRVGERSLDDFSGGQGFLVALALRVAMTKFQARRAGKKIETLVIDEGFGALDAGTLAEVIPALRLVAEEFPCLLVVSHVEGMRDCFGTRIEVAGGPEHSVATVVQG